MTKVSWRSCIALAAAAISFALPAQADPIDFETVPPSIYFPGESFIVDGFLFTFDDQAIGVVDSSVGFFFGNAPSNAEGQFLSSLLGGVTVKDDTGELFQIAGLDFAFIAPFAGVGTPGSTAGQLYLTGVSSNGTMFSQYVDFPVADGDGNFAFSTLSFAQLDAAFLQPLLSLSLSSCVYTEQGNCVFGDNLAQFAVDNIVLGASAVPEPGTLALVLLALGMIGVARRRQLR